MSPARGVAGGGTGPRAGSTRPRGGDARPRAGGVLLAGLVGVVAVALTGCGEGGPGVGVPEPVLGDSAGIVLVEYPPEVLELEAPFRIADEPELRLGVVEGPEELQFSAVRDGARTPEGEVLVLDGRGAPVRRFGPEGEVRGTIGTRGEGPGELRRPERVFAAPGGDVLVWDGRLRALLRFDRTGEFVGEEASFGSVGGLPLVAASVFPGGPVFQEDFPSGSPNGTETTEARLLATAGGGAVDTLARVPAGEWDVAVSGSGGGMVSVEMGRRWYRPQFLAAGAPGGVWHTDGARWEVRRRGEGADPERIVRVQRDPEAFDEALRDRVLEAALEATDDPERRRALRSAHAGRDYPETHPPLHDLFADTEGRIWLGLLEPIPTQLPAGMGAAPTTWLLLGPEGERPIGRLEVPERSRPLHADAEGVLLLRLDDLDVPYVEWRPFVDR